MNSIFTGADINETKALQNKSPMNESVLCFQLLELLRRQSKLQKDFYSGLCSKLHSSCLSFHLNAFPS